MEYKIYCDGKLIAMFENETDRDECMDFLAERYDDCEFKKGENK